MGGKVTPHPSEMETTPPWDFFTLSTLNLMRIFQFDRRTRVLLEHRCLMSTDPYSGAVFIFDFEYLT